MKKLMIVMVVAAMMLIVQVVEAQSYMAGYLSYEASKNIGFDNGVGLTGEVLARGKKFGLLLDGQWTSEAKHGADGFTYHYGVIGRKYWEHFLAGAGLRESGYDSDFPDGLEWEKDIPFFLAEGGLHNFDHFPVDFVVRYFWENKSDNDVRKLGALVDWRAYEGQKFSLVVRYDVGRLWYKTHECNGVGGDPKTGYSFGVAVGLRYSIFD